MTAALLPFERRWAHAVFDTMFPGPGRGALPLGIDDMDLDGFLDDSIANLPFEASLGLRLAVWVVALAPLFVMGRLKTIAALGVADRERVVGVVSASSVYAIRSTVIMLKAMGALFYCGDSRVRTTIVAVAPSAPVVTLRLRAETPGAEHEPHRRIA